MNPGLRRRRRRVHLGPRSEVVPLERVRIEKALATRERYKYVQPRVEREGAGWKVVSPNCSRTVNADGGEIDIAWLVPTGTGAWQLHARDHARGTWVPKAQASNLDEALAKLCADVLHEFWV